MNIPLVSLAVSKWERSSVLKDKHYKNIQVITGYVEVSKLERSSEVKE